MDALRGFYALYIGRCIGLIVENVRPKGAVFLCPLDRAMYWTHHRQPQGPSPAFLCPLHRAMPWTITKSYTKDGVEVFLCPLDRAMYWTQLDVAMDAVFAEFLCPLDRAMYWTFRVPARESRLRVSMPSRSGDVLDIPMRWSSSVEARFYAL